MGKVNKVRAALLILTVFFIVSSCFQLFSQVHRLKFNYLSLEHGLSQNSVYSICQDSKGFMWFGTEDGLNRYDGYDVSVFRHSQDDPGSLLGSVVYSICEDHEAVLWIGTSGGLNKFNGDTGTFSHYRHEPANPNSLSHNGVNAVRESSRHPGILWIGTQEGGLDTFNSRTGKFTHYRFDPTDPHSLGHDTVNTIYEDRSGNIWIGANSGGLHKYDAEIKGFTRYPAAAAAATPATRALLSGGSPDRIFAICEDCEGKLWIGSDAGISRFDPDSGQYIPFHRQDGEYGRLYSNAVRAIHIDRWGRPWIGTLHGGLSLFDPKTGRFRHYRAEPLDAHGLSDNDIWSIYEDRAGVLWIGTEGGGLNKLDLEQKPFVHYRVNPGNPNSLAHNDIWAIYESTKNPGIVWIGTKGGGLNKLNRETETFKIYRYSPGNPHGLNSDTVYTICEDPEGRLWLGTDGGGLNRFDPREETFVHYTYNPTDPNSPGGNYIWVLCRNNDGFIWVGADGGGLTRFDPKKGIFTRFFPIPGKNDSISSHNIWSIHHDADGTLWVGTDNGLNRYHPETGTFTRYHGDPADPGSLNSNRILCLNSDTNGTLWIGTQGGGLNRYDPGKGTFTHYLEKDGLVNNVVYGILEEKSSPCIWVSTNKGLSRFDPRTGTFRNYNKSDGLQGDEFNAGAFCRNQRGEMYFGGLNGFNVFQPMDIRDNPYIPPVVITGFQLFNRDVLPGKAVSGRVITDKLISRIDEITLLYSEDVFSIEFAALHYASPEENRFAYRMDGLEKEWNESGTRRFVTYTHLPPGEYVFRVKASNCDGIWNKTGTSLKITIVPPFWQIWWVKVLFVIFIGALVYLVYWMRIRNIEAQKTKLEVLVNRRTRQLKSKKDELENLDDEKNKLLAELREANKKLEKMSRIDGLTGIPNRRFFDETLETEWKRCRRSKSPISLLMVDVDYFKLYNDTYGHQDGDFCLKWIGAVLTLSLTRVGDLAARYGGEEFAAIMVDADLEGARAKAEDIREQVQDLEISHENSAAGKVVTVSIGVASMIPGDERGFGSLIQAADIALYKAKNSGRNRVCTSG